jgi:hypothetical protein
VTTTRPDSPHGVYEREAIDEHGRGASRGLLVSWCRREQIGKGNLEAIAYVHAQDEGSRSVVFAQNDIAGRKFGTGTGERNDVALQSVDHTAWESYAEPIEEDNLIQGDNVGVQRAAARDGSRRLVVFVSYAEGLYRAEGLRLS